MGSLEGSRRSSQQKSSITSCGCEKEEINVRQKTTLEAFLKWNGIQIH